MCYTYGHEGKRFHFYKIHKLPQEKIRQDFIFTRVELYASEMLLLQYSVTEGQAKGDLDYTNIDEVLIIVLMVESPKAFKEYDKVCGNYIHRFTQMTADTGLTYPTKAKMIYVQLDKCLKQFKEDRNAEAADDKLDKLQLWLSMFADVNDEKVCEAAERDDILRKIREETFKMAQDKEVQRMLIQEKFDRMDIVTYGNVKKKEGEEKGARQQMESDAKGMYAEGLKPDAIARIQKVSVDTIEEILGLQPV